MRTTVAPVLALAAFAALSFSARAVAAQGRSERAEAALARAEAALAGIDGHPNAPSLGGERVRAANWLADLRAAVEAGRTRRALRAAALLEVQVELLRAMLAAARAEAEARDAARVAAEIDDRVEALRARLTRLSLRRHGPELVSAFPSREARDAR